MLSSPNNPQLRFLAVIFGVFVLVLMSLSMVAPSASGKEGLLQQKVFQSPAASTTFQSPGDCGPETYPKLLFEEQVETGAPGWTHAALSEDSWKISSWRSHTGTYAWYVLTPPSIEDQSLFSPPIALPVNESPLSLRFWGYRDIENSSLGCNDGALLEISTDNGQSWLQLDGQLLTDPYDGVIESDYQNPLAGRSAWCGNSQDWLESIVALDEFAGQTAQFRFRLGTDNSHGWEGWYLDDIAVQSCPSAFMATLESQSYRSGLPGQQVLHAVRLENHGLDDLYQFKLQPGSWFSSLQTAGEVSLLSGQVFTATVLVALPAAPGGQQISDTFTLSVQSMNNPDLNLVSTGTSELEINPGLALQSNQSMLVGKPGETITHTFSLTNMGDVEDNFCLLLLGAEWPTVLPSTTGSLWPGEKVSIPVQVTIPSGPLKTAASVITDTFMLQAESGWTDQTKENASSTSSTTLIAGLRVSGPYYLDAFVGVPLKGYFSIENLGNYADRYSLEWVGDWLVEVPIPQTALIAAGEREEIQVMILAPPRIVDGEYSSLSLTATSQLDQTKTGSILTTIHGWKRVFLPLISQYP